MNPTKMKTKLAERFSPFAISQTVYLHTQRTTNIDELTEDELEKIYRVFFPKKPTESEQLLQSIHLHKMKKHRSTILSIATRIGIHHTNDWSKFNNWMLKSSVFKKRLNDYTLTELLVLENQLHAAESNFNRSASKTGNKAWYQKNGFSIPSKS